MKYITDLLRGAANKSGGVQKRVQLGVNGGEVRALADAVYEIIVTAFHLYHVCSLVGEHTDLLMAHLS